MTDPLSSPAQPTPAQPSSDQPSAGQHSPPGCATGTQYTLTRGDATAVVVSLAAGLRLFSRAGTALTESYPDDRTPPGGAGITLAPWANRIDGGRWNLNGAAQQLDITEVPLNNAIHGLLRNTGYALVARSPQHVLLEADIYPQHGYPFLLTHQVRYSISAELDLCVSQTLRNGSAARAPFVLGAHPYLRIGEVPTEELTIRISAATRLLTDERMIPRGAEAVSGPADLRYGGVVGELDLDVSYTDLVFDGGKARQTLSAPDGRSVSLWQEPMCPYVQLFVTDRVPGRRRAVALEPMTGPGDAFNSGQGLGWLEPGEAFTMRWGISADLG
ncbi:MAG: aldose 1-epimerase family protein [Actinomycetota bacterium]|nr:aldose 1-epimerase family protein [Actinomycetota bacterium]